MNRETFDKLSDGEKFQAYLTLDQWITDAHNHLDNVGIPRINEGGGILTVFGRLEKYNERIDVLKQLIQGYEVQRMNSYNHEE